MKITTTHRIKDLPGGTARLEILVSVNGNEPQAITYLSGYSREHTEDFVNGKLDEAGIDALYHTKVSRTA